MTRAEVFAGLRSFDHAGIAQTEFERQTLALLVGSPSSAAEAHSRFLAREPRSPLIRTLYQGERELGLGPEDLATAEELCRNVFEFYGEKHDLGPDIDWESNPGTAHWGHDLNRFTYLRTLTAAAHQTGEQRFVRKAAELILDWIAKTDVCDAGRGSGPNPRSTCVWQSYITVSLHLAIWCECLEEIAAALSPMEFLAVLKSVHDQMAWLEQVVHNYRNNWLVIGTTDMILVSLALPELRDAERFKDYAWTHLLADIPREVLSDGVQFELTPSYHALVCQYLCDCAALCRAFAEPVPQLLEEITSSMLDYQMQTITPDDKLLCFNDSDPDAAGYVRQMLAREGRRRERADWLYIGTGGAEGVEPSVRSQAFPHGGVYVMRTGWSSDSTYLAFDGGPWGATHQHDDRLSFQLSALGRAFIVDPGRYLYDWDNPFSGQAYLNSTRAHSTITVDGAGQADRDFPETHVPGPELTANRWVSRRGFDQAASAHTLGYGPGGRIAVVHRRCVTFWHEGVILVVDRLEGSGEHEIHSRLQFAPGEVVPDGPVWHTCYDDANLAVVPLVKGEFAVRVEKGQLDPTSGWYSDSYNRIEPSPTLVVHARSALPLRGGFLLAPYRGRTRPSLTLRLTQTEAVATVNERSYRLRWEEAF